MIEGLIVHLGNASVARKGLDAVCSVLRDVEIFHNAPGTSGSRLDDHFCDVESQLANVRLSISAIVQQGNVAKIVLHSRKSKSAQNQCTAVHAL